jgi:hypothetical protein
VTRTSEEKDGEEQSGTSVAEDDITHSADQKGDFCVSAMIGIY